MFDWIPLPFYTLLYYQVVLMVFIDTFMRSNTDELQLQENIDEVIVPMDNKEAAKAIVKFIQNSKEQKQLLANMKNINYRNENKVKKLYVLMEVS